MKCIYLLLFLEFILPISLKAQSISSFDSLQTAFSRATSDTAKLRILFADRPMKYMGNSDGLRSPVGALENNVMLTNWGALTQDEFVETTQNLGQEIRQVRTMLDREKSA